VGCEVQEVVHITEEVCHVLTWQGCVRVVAGSLVRGPEKTKTKGKVAKRTRVDEGNKSGEYSSALLNVSDVQNHKHRHAEQNVFNVEYIRKKAVETNEEKENLKIASLAILSSSP
jgi:hypothetical protein